MGTGPLTARVGIVGCGFIGAVHSRALKALVDAGLVDARVVATCDVDRSRAEAFGRAHGAEVVAADATQLLGAVDVVWICTPTASHLDLVEAFAGAGAAVFCEKPLGRSLAEARDIAAAVDRAGVPCQVGLVLRTAPVMLRLREGLASGRWGRVMAAVLRDDQFLPDQGHYASTWRTDVDVAGGGTLIEHSIHDLDLLRWLLGDIEEVSAAVTSLVGHPGIDAAVLRTASGAVATLTSVWHQVLSRASTRRLEILAERAVVWLDDDRIGPLHVQTDDGTATIECPPPAWTVDLPIRHPDWRTFAGYYAVEDRAFLDAVAADRAPDPGPAEAVRAHVLVEAVYAAARKGTSVASALLA